MNKYLEKIAGIPKIKGTGAIEDFQRHIRETDIKQRWFGRKLKKAVDNQGKLIKQHGEIIGTSKKSAQD